MDFLPIFQRVRGSRCVLVGGGEVAARKFTLMHRAGAAVTVVSPLLGESLRRAHDAGELEHVAAAFDSARLDGAALVIAATGRDVVNREVAAAAARRGIPVNVVDAPELCTFVMPAIVDRSPLIVAVSSGGAAPVIARRVRAAIEAMLPTAFGRFVAWAGSLRGEVADRVPVARRRRFWEQLARGSAAQRVMAGDARGARREANALFEGAATTGSVALVGAGPGDPDLLTLKALHALQEADVIVHDRLVAPEILERARRDAELINVGKASNRHLLPQGDINALLIMLARAGRRVVRLKGGDPFVFGRGGEEAEALAAAGIAVDVVPGISAMAGIGAACNIPLTHRDHADRLIVMTGHRCDGRALECDWQQLAANSQTVVCYMGLSSLDSICRNLIAVGAPATRPAALVSDGTRPTQQVITGTLATLPRLVDAAAVASPALIIIGDVVSVRAKIDAAQVRPRVLDQVEIA